MRRERGEATVVDWQDDRIGIGGGGGEKRMSINPMHKAHAAPQSGLGSPVVPLLCEGGECAECTALGLFDLRSA
jgi:hypothetical protein